MMDALLAGLIGGPVLFFVTVAIHLTIPEIRNTYGEGVSN